MQFLRNFGSFEPAHHKTGVAAIISSRDDRAFQGLFGLVITFHTHHLKEHLKPLLTLQCFPVKFQQRPLSRELQLAIYYK